MFNRGIFNCSEVSESSPRDVSVPIAFYCGPPLLTTDRCISFLMVVVSNHFPQSLLRDASKQKQIAHRTAVTLQTFLPCLH